jgi:hypothetical protein
MIGILLQDEKVPGVHLAFGDPYGSQTNADWSSRTHVDVLTRGCNVWIDDDQVIAEGQYLLEKFSNLEPPARHAGPASRGRVEHSAESRARFLDSIHGLRIRTPKVTA